MKQPLLFVLLPFLLVDRTTSINVTLHAFENTTRNNSDGLDNMLVSQTINTLIKEMTSFCNDNHINCDLVYKLLRERITNTSTQCSWIDQNLVLIVVIVVLKLVILGMSSILARSHCLNDRRAQSNVEDAEQRHELKELVS